MDDIPEAAQRARQMYADGATTAAIKAETGLTGHAIYVWLDGGPPVGGRRPLEPIPRRVVRARRVTAGERHALVARIMRSSEQQVGVIEQRVDPRSGQMDKDARTLAVISRTLSELGAIDERDREIERRKALHDDDKSRSAEQPVPRNVDELRRSLARKLEAIIAERDSETPREPR
jgi:hypothetical protein